MTVPVQNPIVAYVGNGISTMFVFPFRVLSDDDLTVTINGSAPSIPFTIDGIGNDTGSVTFARAPAPGDRILLFRGVALMRSEDYQDNGDLLADTVNADFDRIWMALQGQGYLIGGGDPANSRVLMLGRDDTNGSGAYRANGNRITNLGDVVADTDAVNQRSMFSFVTSYVDRAIAGIVGGVGWFLQAGVGAVFRTFQDKMRDVVSVKDFGAIGDGQYHPLSERFATLAAAQFAYPNVPLQSLEEAIDGVALMAAIKALGSRGGGVVLVHNMTLVVHIPDSMIDNSTTNHRQCAVRHDESNVIIRGSGWMSSAIKCYSSAGKYGPIEMIKLPLENGITKITGSGIEDICLDGSATGFAGQPDPDGDEASLLLTAGLGYCRFNNLRIINGKAYGIALENGGYLYNTITNILIDNIGQDAIDMKDNGAISVGNTLKNVVITNWGLMVNAAEPYAGIDVMGIGWHIDDIKISKFGAQGSPNVGVRFKQGNPSYDRGMAGDQSTLSNFRIEQTGQTVTGFIGVHIKASRVVVNTGHVINSTGYGVIVEQPAATVMGVQCTSTNGDATTIGFYARQKTSNDSLYPGADGTRFIGCVANGFGTGFTSYSPNVKFTEGHIVSCPTPFALLGASATGNCVTNNEFDNVTNAPSITSSSTHQIFGNKGLDTVASLPNYTTPFGTILNLLGPTRIALWSNGAEQVRVDGVADAVNRLHMRGATTGSYTRLYANGSDTDIPFQIASQGAGYMRLTAPTIYFDGTVAAPYSDNVTSLGSGSKRFTQVFAVNTAISSSDATLKTAVSPLSAAEIATAQQLARELGTFKWLDSVAEKGADNARLHAGMTVQRAIEIFQANGLDPMRYGIICFDQWDAEPAIIDVDDDGVPFEVFPARPAGQLYSFRYEELLAFIVRGLAASDDSKQAAIDALAARVAALESKQAT